jgi:HEAT repeat protein
MADSTLQQIVQLLASAETSPELRQAAIRVAGAVGSGKDRALVKALLALLDGSDAPVRALAIEALGNLHAEEALPHLEALVRHGGAELEAAVHAASQLGARGAKLMGKIMAQVLPSLRARIADVLARSGTGNALVVTAQSLFDSDPKVIDATARSLATEVPSYSSAQRAALARFLGEALDGKNQKLSPRSEAAVLRVLGALHDGKWEEVFWSRLTPAAASEVRAAALQALGAKVEPSTDAKLQKILACAADPEFQIVATALTILRSIPVNPKHTRHWLKLLEAPDVATRRFAVEKLHDLDKAEVAQALATQLSHPDRALRDDALHALRASGAGRSALVDRLLEADGADDAWFLARAVAPAAGALPAPIRTRLFEQALAYQEAEDRRAAAFWFLLREGDSAWVRDQLEEKAEALRKKKKYDEALTLYRLLIQDPACGEETRFAFAATALKLSNHDLSPEHRSSDPALHQFGRLLQNAGFDVLGRLAKEKWLEAGDLFYLGFHFVEQSHRLREFGRQVLELVIKRSAQSDLGKQAKRKLKSEALL